MIKALSKKFCRECGYPMVCKNNHKISKGNFDRDWVCSAEGCMTSCVENVRFGNPISENWRTEKGNMVKDIKLFYSRL